MHHTEYHTIRYTGTLAYTIVAYRNHINWSFHIWDEYLYLRVTSLFPYLRQ